MFRKTLAIALLGVTLTAPVLARDAPPVHSIDVKTTLSDFNNPAAVVYWKFLDADLETAIAALLVNRLGDRGLDLMIDMNEVELANAFETRTGMAQTTMSGRVKVYDKVEGRHFKTFDLKVTMGQALSIPPPGNEVKAVARTNDQVYRALVTTFAQEVVNRMDN